VCVCVCVFVFVCVCVCVCVCLCVCVCPEINLIILFFRFLGHWNDADSMKNFMLFYFLYFYLFILFILFYLFILCYFILFILCYFILFILFILFYSFDFQVLIIGDFSLSVDESKVQFAIWAILGNIKKERINEIKKQS